MFRLNRAPVQMRFNIAPSQNVPVIRITHDSQERETIDMRWGLIPSWAKDAAIGNRTINAKSETLFEKPSFRKAARVRRCLIPSDGFFEWKKEGKTKQPYFIYMKDRQPFAFAGLWETWKPKNEGPIQSFTIVTTQANPLIESIHPRMPVIIPFDCHDAWLDPNEQSPERIAPLLRPFPEDRMALHPVGNGVNNPRFDAPECIQEQTVEDRGFLF